MTLVLQAIIQFKKGKNCMQVELIDKMGTDLTVVNAARVSYAKT